MSVAALKLSPLPIEQSRQLPLLGKQVSAYKTVPVARWHVIGGLCLMHGYRYGAELGVSTGRFTSYLCAIMRDLKMIAVDTWVERPENTAPGQQTYVDWGVNENYANFKNTCDLFFGERVEIKRMDTVAAAETVEDDSLDFVFIDADHSYEGCKRDIEAWYPKVRDGGLIAGHDYSDKWPTVMRAVDEKFKLIGKGPDKVWLHFKR